MPEASGRGTDPVALERRLKRLSLTGTRMTGRLENVTRSGRM